MKRSMIVDFGVMVKKALDDFEYFARHCVKIRRKDGTVGPFVLNNVQRKLLKIVESKKPVRVIILKARQMGISTFIEIYLLWRMLRDGGVNVLMLAHERDAASYILGMTRFAVAHLPKWFIQLAGVETEYFTKYEISFKHNNSRLMISSADSKEPGRSRTLHYAHFSEAGFYDNAEVLMRAVFAAIPDLSNTVVFIESTGNGPAGWYYDTFKRAQAGKNEYDAVFFPWYECEEYRRPVPDGVEVVCPPSLQKLYEEGVIDKEQLYWRQWTIDNKYNGDEYAFATEYPATVDEGFLQESANVFSPQAVQARLNEVEYLKPKVGYLEAIGQGVRFIEAQRERLTIYKQPEPGRVYVIGSDVGSGVVVNREGDASCSDVLDAVTGEQVAHLHEVVEPTLYAKDLFLLGKFYNTALIAVEITGGHGLLVVTWLRDNGYTALYQRRVYDKVSGTFVNRLGWDTTRRTKAFMIDALRASFYNGEVIVNHPDTLREMLTFIKDGSKLEAIQGAHDDRVMSLAVSVMALREYGQALKAFSGQSVQQQQQQVPEQNIRMRSRTPVKEYHPELGAYW